MESLTLERSSLKVLHLYSDWKWTGPAEPVLQICKALQERGHDIKIAFRSAPITYNKTIEQKADEMGIKKITRFSLDRHITISGIIKDLVILPYYLLKERPHILHMHLSHDHVIGTLCAFLIGKRRPLLIRSFHKRSVLKPTLYNKALLKCTDGYIFFTEGFRRKYISTFGLDPSKTAVQPMTVDLERFDPTKRYKDMRKEFGIPKHAIVIGTVARFQRYRRIDWFLEAAKRLLEMHDNVYFLLIGRSSQIKETVIEPIKRLGIEDKVILAGYRTEDYVDSIFCLDIFTLLMPGSDGTARALREAMSMGKVCVVSDFGMLPEIVDGGKVAVVVKNKDELAYAWSRLVEDEKKRKLLGKKARQYAVKMFDIKRAAQVIEKFYLSLLSKGYEDH